LRNIGGGAVSKVESAWVVLVPSGVVFLRVGSGLSNLLYYFYTGSEILQRDMHNRAGMEQAMKGTATNMYNYIGLFYIGPINGSTNREFIACMPFIYSAL